MQIAGEIRAKFSKRGYRLADLIVKFPRRKKRILTRAEREAKTKLAKSRWGRIIGLGKKGKKDAERD